MRAGPMRHKVTIQEVTETQDSYGQASESWATFATRWASIEPIAGREYFASRTENSEADVRIRLRWDRALVALTTKHRVLYTLPLLDESPETSQTRIFDIEAILNMRERNREIVLMCREVL